MPDPSVTLLLRRLLCGASLFVMASCQGAERIVAPPPVASIEVAPDSTAAAAIGETVAFTAVARDASGSAIPDVAFAWSSSATAVAVVDPAGVATTVSNGATEIQASAQGISGTAELTVEQEPAAITAVAGNAQSALARGALSTSLRVRVTDSRAHPVAGVPVSWQVLSGGGTITGTATGADGEATATWTMGSEPGPVSARASVAVDGGTLSTTFSGTALPNGVIQGTISRSSSYLAPLRARPGAGAVTTSAASFRERSVPDELLVRVRTESLALPAVGSAAYRSAGRASAAASSLHAAAARWAIAEGFEVLGASPALATLRIRVPPGLAEVVRRRLLDRPEVANVEPNGIAWSTARLAGVTTDFHPDEGTSYAAAAALSEPYFTRQAWHYDATNAIRAWDVTTGDANVIVAVLDDGIRFDHPDIAANLRSDGYDFVSMQTLSACTTGSFTTSMDGDGPDSDPTIPASLSYDEGSGCVIGPSPTGGHGLHVAGTIGARAANGQGGVGIAWQVGIRPIRALGSHGSGTHYDIAQAILYAAGLPADGGSAGVVQAVSGARLINLSLAGTGGSSTLQNAVVAATEAGSLIIAAAGNDNASTAYYPAAYPEVLSVSAIAPSLDRAPYSNYGSTVDIAGPGGSTGMGADHGVWSLWWSFQSAAPTYESLQGTSMAVPHVTGVAALVLAANPALTRAQLRARLLDHATDIGPSGDDEEFGAGLVDAAAAVRNGAPERRTYVRVYDADTGAVHGPVLVDPSGAYSLGELPDGDYYVYAGEDDSGDAVTGLFDRRWGARGGSTTPTSVSIDRSSIESASFAIGYPQESEDNDAVGSADELPVGGYAYGTIEPGSDADFYRFVLDAAKTIVIETDALLGACGFTDQVDTALRLLDANGARLATHDDIDGSLGRHCSRIQGVLPAGTYYVEVTGWDADQGYYAVRVTEEP
jgi:subtilisin family serine protease